MTMNRKKTPTPGGRRARACRDANEAIGWAPFAFVNIAHATALCHGAESSTDVDKLLDMRPLHPVLRQMQPALARLWRRDPARWFELAHAILICNNLQSFARERHCAEPLRDASEVQ